MMSVQRTKMVKRKCVTSCSTGSSNTALSSTSPKQTDEQSRTSHPSMMKSKIDSMDVTSPTAKVSSSDKCKISVISKDTTALKPENRLEKPLFPYMKFAKSVYPTLRTQHPDAKLSEIGVLTGKLWREMDPEHKKVLVSEYEHEQAEYRRRKEELGLPDNTVTKRRKISSKENKVQPSPHDVNAACSNVQASSQSIRFENSKMFATATTAATKSSAIPSPSSCSESLIPNVMRSSNCCFQFETETELAVAASDQQQQTQLNQYFHNHNNMNLNNNNFTNLYSFGIVGGSANQFMMSGQLPTKPQSDHHFPSFPPTHNNLAANGTNTHGFYPHQQPMASHQPQWNSGLFVPQRASSLYPLPSSQQQHSITSFEPAHQTSSPSSTSLPSLLQQHHNQQTRLNQPFQVKLAEWRELTRHLICEVQSYNKFNLCDGHQQMEFVNLQTELLQQSMLSSSNFSGLNSFGRQFPAGPYYQNPLNPTSSLVHTVPNTNQALAAVGACNRPLAHLQTGLPIPNTKQQPLPPGDSSNILRSTLSPSPINEHQSKKNIHLNDSHRMRKRVRDAKKRLLKQPQNMNKNTQSGGRRQNLDSDNDNRHQSNGNINQSIPQRPLTAYMRFSTRVYPSVRSSNPEAKLSDVGRITGRMWRNLTSDDKERLMQEYQNEKAQYDMEIQNLKNKQKFDEHSSLPDHQATSTASRSCLVNDENRANQTVMDGQCEIAGANGLNEIVSSVKDIKQNVSNKKKLLKEKIRRLKKANLIDANVNLNDNMYGIISEIPMPPPKPLTPYMRFSTRMYETMRSQYPMASLADLGRITGQMWRDLDKSIRQPIMEEYNHERDRYIAQMKAFKDHPVYQQYLKMTSSSHTVVTSLASSASPSPHTTFDPSHYNPNNRNSVSLEARCFRNVPMDFAVNSLPSANGIQVINANALPTPSPANSVSSSFQRYTDHRIIKEEKFE